MSYAVVWEEGNGPIYAGRLELRDGRLDLIGTALGSGPTHRTLRFCELGLVSVERRRVLCLGGRPTLIAEMPGRPRLRIGSLDGAGALHELAELLHAGAAGAAA
jgi:hypothetical protein